MLLEAQERARQAGTMPPPSGPPMSTYTPEVERLDEILFRLEIVAASVIKGAGGKPQEPKPRPRPETAMDRAKVRWRQMKHEALVARMLPHRRTDD